MSTEYELQYQKEELRKMLIAIVESHGGKIEVPYASYGTAGERTLHIGPDDAGQRYVLTAK
jgi:hypothetical protein